MPSVSVEQKPDLNYKPLGYQPGATLGGQTWRGQLRGEFYHYCYLLYYLGTGERT